MHPREETLKSKSVWTNEPRQHDELETLGWDARWQERWQAEHPDAQAAGWIPARVITASREIYRLASPLGDTSALGELSGDLAGRLRYLAEEDGEELPAVGDWVVAQPLPVEARAILHAVLPRRSCLARRAAGRRTAKQVVAANVDTVWVVTSLNRDFNPRRLERYLELVWEAGCRPVVVLSKADLCDATAGQLAAQLAQVEALAPGVPVHALSALEGEGLEPLAAYLQRGQTVALLGSSGVGKSTLSNRLLGADVQIVREIRSSDDRGRHATSHRELLPLPSGGLLVDTPGMRELGLWREGGEGPAGFGEIDGLAEDCRFGDCQHQGEPGCAVGAAIDAGQLDAERLESYHKLVREDAFLAERAEAGAAVAEKRKWVRMMGSKFTKTTKRRLHRR